MFAQFLQKTVKTHSPRNFRHSESKKLRQNQATKFCLNAMKQTDPMTTLRNQLNTEESFHISNLAIKIHQLHRNNQRYIPKSDRSHYPSNYKQFSQLGDEQVRVRLERDPFFRMKMQAYIQQNKKTQESNHRAALSPQHRLEKCKSLRMLKSEKAQQLIRKINIFHEYSKCRAK